MHQELVVFLSKEKIEQMMMRRRLMVQSAAGLLLLMMMMNMQVMMCQEVDDYSNINITQLSNDPAGLNKATQMVYNSLSDLTTDFIHGQIARQSRFCVTDPDEDWDRSFNFSNNLDFLSDCIRNTQGDLPQRLCTGEELKFYYTNFIENIKNLNTPTFPKPNKNCNLSTWVSGCEPGWACSAGLSNPLKYFESKEIPDRTSNCQPCCDGFFCPMGLTCMIPCPLGSYCHKATLNVNTGLCDPYAYQLPHEKPNHTCGGANVWQDVTRGSSMFCSAGSYCPTSTQEKTCTKGHYCRKGSTEEIECYKLSSCNPKSAKQSMTQYGIMLIVGISVILVIFYLFYEHLTNLVQRRYARSREDAVKSVKESAQADAARARWRAARDAIKNTAVQMSRTLSRRNRLVSGEQQQQYGATSERKVDIEANFPPTQEIKEHRKSLFKTVNPETATPELEDVEANNPPTQDLLADKKKLRSDSQIFRYAYKQLEMEKIQQQDKTGLAFSGVDKDESRRRPPMEIAFRDLTVSLKQKKKHLLRCVNGEIRPGRITALMGPSGAGKTTLLSALAGKTAGCSIGGLILINGKVESIRSYKRIVGFVPQDDVVHGNLTVEENIWFSANCRLSADLPKADKVLIVERVIECLGLQHVRDSLVGTVEKRGISGGQKKRVNVGLELVMEPSLLFLDEPTSGLDSSSSQLLLKALKREADEGVNICLVVHQPSYALFTMFDDLILLAKGGLTAYHGPVSDVEDYFAQLEINVPERINPPDYFIDVLEGMVKPSTSSGLTYEELPIRWMLHKGYPVPADMQKNISGAGNMASTVENSEDQENGPEQLSFCGEFWQNLKYKVEARCDVIRNSFLTPKDLSRRQTPFIPLQYWHFLGRIAKQRLREVRMQVTDYLILLLAGACLGLLSKENDETFGTPGYMYTIIATSLLCKIAALRTFSLDKLQFRRERASGISSLAHFVAKDTVDHFNTLIKPLVYLSMFYFFSNPRSLFLDNYIILLCLVYCVTGIAYTLAIVLEPGPSQLCSVLLPVVLTLLSTKSKDSDFIKNLAKFCYPNWAMEAFIISNARRYYGVWLIQRCIALVKSNYDLHHWGFRVSLLMATGAACRILAFVGMLLVQKK